jgi:membrane protease YdiL (CAAX protease family)
MQSEINQRRAQNVAMAMVFEAALGFAGVLVAYLGGIDLKSQLVVSQEAVLNGLLACLPMLAMLQVLYLVKWQPLLELRYEVERIVGELFGGSSWFELALVSIAAGVGEEILFRGALQPLGINWLTFWPGFILVAILFGLAHAMTKIYFVMATVIGFYFGWLALQDNNLVTPIVAHAVYDFLALAIIQHRVGKGGSEPPAI